MDSHHVTTYRTPVEGKHFLVFGDRVGLAEIKLKKVQRRGEGGGAAPDWVWNKRLFTEYSSVTVAANAVVVAGVDWQGQGPEAVATGGIVALNPKDGKLLWKHALPAPPVMFGAIVDRDGQILVGLRDGRVVSFK